MKFPKRGTCTVLRSQDTMYWRHLVLILLVVLSTQKCLSRCPQEKLKQHATKQPISWGYDDVSYLANHRISGQINLRNSL